MDVVIENKAKSQEQQKSSTETQSAQEQAKSVERQRAKDLISVKAVDGNFTIIMLACLGALITGLTIYAIVYIARLVFQNPTEEI